MTINIMKDIWEIIIKLILHLVLILRNNIATKSHLTRFQYTNQHSQIKENVVNQELETFKKILKSTDRLVVRNYLFQLPIQNQIYFQIQS